MKPKTSLILIALFTLALACNLKPSPAEPKIDEIGVATSVAATTAAQLTLNTPACCRTQLHRTPICICACRPARAFTVFS